MGVVGVGGVGRMHLFIYKIKKYFYYKLKIPTPNKKLMTQQIP